MEEPWYMKKWKRQERETPSTDEYRYQRQHWDSYGQIQYQYRDPAEDPATMRRLTFKRIFFIIFALFCMRLMFRSMIMLNVQYRKGRIMDIANNCMTPDERNVLKDLFRKFHEEATKHNVTYFLQYGTLLGSWRHHAMIPWDDDVDVAVSMHDRRRIMEIFDPRDSGEYLAFDTGDPTRGLKFYSRRHSVMIPDKTWKYPFLDITFYDENQTHIWDTFGPESHRKYLKHRIFPLTKRPFEGLMVNCPKDPVYVIRKCCGDENVCVASTTNHMHEIFHPRVVSVDCRELGDRLNFVERHVVNGKVYEKMNKNIRLIYENNHDHIVRHH